MLNDFTDSILERSLFRRQFILSRKTYKPNSFWNNILLRNNLVLSVHSDLPYYKEETEEKTILLLGLAIDSLKPDLNEHSILKDLFNHSKDLMSLITNTNSLSGRWIIIYQKGKTTYLFNDLTGLRQIYFYSYGEETFCASQPEIIKTQTTLEYNDDKELRQFLLHPNLGNRESLWGGSSTIYKNCYLLLPNHYFDYNNNKQVRFYFGTTKPKLSTKEAVANSSHLLQNIVASAISRYDIRFALTGGLDSRTLLAAAKEYRSKINFFVDRMGILPKNHSDVVVPRKISNKFNLTFNVLNSKNYIPGWFVSLLSNNVTGARILPKTNSIFSKFLENSDKININGNVNMICKKHYIEEFRKNWNKPIQELTVEDLVYMFSYKDIPKYLVNEFNRWKEDLELYPDNLFDIFEMFLWEQRLSSWGALYPSEQDIASEELSPFNCRLLIETIMQTPNEILEAQGYPVFTKMIHYMWPELLKFPINPEPKFTIEKVREFIKIFIPDSVYGKLRKIKRKWFPVN